MPKIWELEQNGKFIIYGVPILKLIMVFPGASVSNACHMTCDYGHMANDYS